jgi:host factor-I protein
MNESFADQESFLDSLINRHRPVNIFLVNGIRLSGTIRSYDQSVLLLDSPTGIQTIYKHSISTVQDSEYRGPNKSLPRLGQRKIEPPPTPPGYHIGAAQGTSRQ